MKSGINRKQSGHVFETSSRQKNGVRKMELQLSYSRSRFLRTYLGTDSKR